MNDINYENELTAELVKLLENDGSVIMSYLPTDDTRRVWENSEIFCKYSIRYVDAGVDSDDDISLNWYIWNPTESNTLLIESQETGIGKLFPIYDASNITLIIDAINDAIKLSSQLEHDNNIKSLLNGIHKITDAF